MAEGARRATGAMPRLIRHNLMEGSTMSGNTEKNKTSTKRKLSAEKKYQIFLETQRGEKPTGEILRREGLYASDLTRIRKQVQEGAIDRLSAKPGKRPKVVSSDEYEQLKAELQEKERALADLSVELAILRKKTNGGSWER